MRSRQGQSSWNRDTYDAERQLTKALGKLAKAAHSPDLRATFEMHLEETKRQIDRLGEVFASLAEKVDGKHCGGIAGTSTNANPSWRMTLMAPLCTRADCRWTARSPAHGSERSWRIGEVYGITGGRMRY